MKCKTMRHEIIEFQWMTLLLLFTICFSSCKDDKAVSYTHLTLPTIA